MALSENVVTALIIAVPAFFSAPLLAWLTARHARKAREQDWARQDLVAANAAEASRKLLASQEAAASILETSTHDAVIARQETYSQLTAIHTLVNSNMTAALQAEFDSTKRELVALREIMEIKTANGQKASVDALAVIETAERRIEELDALLADRKRKDELAQAQITAGQLAGKIADASTRAAKPAAEQAARRIVPPVVTEVVPPVVKAAVREALDEHDKNK